MYVCGNVCVVGRSGVVAVVVVDRRVDRRRAAVVGRDFLLPKERRSLGASVTVLLIE